MRIRDGRPRGEPTGAAVAGARVAVTVLLAALVAGCSGTPSAGTGTGPPEPPIAGPTTAGASPAPGAPSGAPAAADGRTLPLMVTGVEVGSVTVAGPVERRGPLWPQGPAPRAGRYLSWTVAVQIRGSLPVDVSPLDFRVVTDDGRTFDDVSGSLVYVGKQALQSVTVRNGGTITGTVTFDVTDGTGRLSYVAARATPLSWPY